MIFTIALRELRSLFLSPLAWAVLAVVQLILGFLFLGQVDLFLRAQSELLAMSEPPGLTEIVVTPLLANASIVLLLAVPLVTMRLVSEERRGRTLTLLFSAPVSMTEIVLGKYVGIMLFLLLIVALIALMPLSLLLGGGLDLGMFAASLLGLVLLVGAFAAVGLFMSVMTHHPAVAGIATFGALLLLWVLDWSGQGTAGDSVLAYLSLLNHFEPFLQGVFDSSDAAYYLLFIATFVVLSVRRLDAERMGV
jgi:ABC-2 type transport system permease protein